MGAGSSANMQVVAGPVAASSWLLALLAVMFTYSGWNAASHMAEEIRDPGRNVPKALALGTGAVIVIYLLLNALYLYVMPVGDLAKVQGSVLDVVADKMLGSAAGNIMGVVSIVSLLASVSANIFAGPRVYYAMARDGVFLPVAARIHPTYRTPAAAIVAQAIWASILIMSGSADTLTTYTGFAVTLFATIAVAAVFVLRSREPNAERPFKAWGYPYAGAVRDRRHGDRDQRLLFRADDHPRGRGGNGGGHPAVLLLCGGKPATHRDQLGTEAADSRADCAGRRVRHYRDGIDVPRHDDPGGAPRGPGGAGRGRASHAR